MAYMFVNFSYAELCELKACLARIESVYGSGKTIHLQHKLDECIEYMDTVPINEIYPRFVEGVGTVIT